MHESIGTRDANYSQVASTPHMPLPWNVLLSPRSTKKMEAGQTSSAPHYASWKPLQ